MSALLRAGRGLRLCLCGERILAGALARFCCVSPSSADSHRGTCNLCHRTVDRFF